MTKRSRPTHKKRLRRQPKINERRRTAERGELTRTEAISNAIPNFLPRRSKQPAQKRPTQEATIRRRKKQQRLAPIRGRLRSAQSALYSPRLLSGLFTMLVTAALYFTATNPRFQITDITPQGNTIVSASYLKEQSGLYGSHIFTVNSDAIEERLTAVPGVISADIDLRWPHGASITVIEDQPLAVWQDMSGEAFWVNQYGQLIPAESQDMLKTVSLPRIIDQIGERPEPLPADTILAQDIRTTEERIKQYENISTPRPDVPHAFVIGANTLYHALQTANNVTVSTLTLNKTEGLSFVETGGWVAYQNNNRDLLSVPVQGGWIAYFGTAENAKTQVAVYNALIAELLSKGITPTMIDVSDPDRPFYSTVATQ